MPSNVSSHLHSPPSPTHFSMWQILTKHFACFQLLSQNPAKTLLVLTPNILFQCRDGVTSYVQEKLQTGAGVCKVLLCQKSMCERWRGAWVHTGWQVWDLGNSMIIHVWWKAIWEKNFANDTRSIQLTKVFTKVFQNKFGQVEEKSFDLILCLFGFVKTTNFRDSSEFSGCIQNVLAKSCLPC